MVTLMHVEVEVSCADGSLYQEAQGASARAVGRGGGVGKVSPVLTRVSASRYLVICYPMKAKYISTAKRARVIVVVIWIAAMGLSAVPACLIDYVSSSFVFRPPCFSKKSSQF